MSYIDRSMFKRVVPGPGQTVYGTRGRVMLQMIGLSAAFGIGSIAWAAPGDGGSFFAGSGGSSGHGGDAYPFSVGDAGSNGSGGNGATAFGVVTGGTGGAAGSISTFAGGNGGDGASGSSNYSGAGGGGGGAGVFLTSGALTLTSATGGDGGNGGNSSGALGGGGGGGGNGATLINGGTLTNQGSITGGNGGNGGSGAVSGYAGAGGGGGHGVSGANLQILNSGTISAGQGGAGGSSSVPGGQDGAAVQFTAGNNSLVLRNGSVINGVVWLMANTNATVTAENSGLNLNDGVLLDSGSALTVDAQQGLSIGVITGSGSLTKTGNGTLTLTGANDYTGATVIEAGTLALSGLGTLGSGALILSGSSAVFDLSASSANTSQASLAGSGDILLGSGTFSVGSDNSSTTYSGNLSGAGRLIKLGTGKLVLEGSVAPQGGSEVSAGTLIVGGSAGSSATLSSDVTVDSGAVLGGHGLIIGNVLLNNGATLSPGNSIGTLTVNGNVTYSAGSTMVLEANPDGTSDRLIATGTVDLGGSTLNVLAGAGNWAAATSYNIVQAGTLQGTFGTVTTDLAFLTASLSYSATTAELQLRRNDVSFASVAQTPNQRAVATALGNTGASLSDSIASLSAEQARTAYDSLSGEIYASTRTALFDESRLVRETVTDQLRHAQAHLNDGSTLHHDPATGLVVWLKGYGGWSDTDGDSNVADLDRETYGTLLGLDIALNDVWRVGAFTGYGRSEFDSHTRDSSAVSQNTHLGAYLGGQWDQWRLRLGGAQTWHQIDSKRTSRLGTRRDTLKGDYDARTTQVFGEAGYSIRLDALELELFAGITRVSVDSDSLRERGGDTALQGRSDKDSATYSHLGLRVAAPIARIAGKPLALQSSLAWQHVLDAPSRNRSLQLNGYDAFTIEGSATARNTAVVQAGVGLALSNQARVDVGYSGLFGDGSTDHGVRVGLSVSF